MKYIHTALCQLVQQEEIVAHLTQPDFGTFFPFLVSKENRRKKKMWPCPKGSVYPISYSTRCFC
jgi:hypothetical protein